MLRIGDNTGLHPNKVSVYSTGLVACTELPQRRYLEMSRVVREWRNLMMLKRAGRGHDPGGANVTAPGELALDCPACPQPDCNLPDGWQDAPDSEKYMYDPI